MDVSQSKFDQDWELALREREEQEISSKKKDPEKKYIYFFGMTLKKGEPISYLTKEVEKLPKGAFNIKKFEAISSEAPIIADKLLSEWSGIIQKEVDFNNEPIIPTVIDHVVIDQDIIRKGIVARHVTNGHEHMSIIFQIRKNGSVPCVFFTSKPEWVRGSAKRKSRKATKEEIALAGMVTSKETYLTSAVRHVSEFFPTGTDFPPDRLSKMYEEFFQDAWDL